MKINLIFIILIFVFFCFQIICGQNSTFVIQANGTVMASGEGSYGRLGQGNSDDLHSLTVISSLQGIHSETVPFFSLKIKIISLHIINNNVCYFDQMV